MEAIVDQMDLPPESLINAVEKSGKSLTASDAATLTGMDLAQAKKGLLRLAYLTGGDLSVTNDGELVYSFKKNVKDVLLQNSTGQRARQLIKTVWPYLFYGIRVGFGVMLLLSLAIITVSFTVFASTSSSSSNDDEKDNRNRVSINSGFPQRVFWGGGGGFSPFDIFYYQNTYGYYTSPTYRPNFYSSDIMEDPEPRSLSFFESFFSYVFGDGNPNESFEQEQLKAAARVIRENNGVVTAEQLAPYLNPIKPPSFSLPSNPNPNPVSQSTSSSSSEELSTSVLVDESFVLPVVAKLGGEPMVTKDGDILYKFQDLMTTASASATGTANANAGVAEAEFGRTDGYNNNNNNNNNIFGDKRRSKDSNSYNSAAGAVGGKIIPAYITEKEYPFSCAPPSNLVWTFLLGVVNLVGVVSLQTSILSSQSFAMAEPAFFKLLSSLYPFLSAYAFLYNAIPLVRYFRHDAEQKDIQKRNEMREMWALGLKKEGGRLLKTKLEAAREEAAKIKGGTIDNSDIFYSSSSSNLPQM